MFDVFQHIECDGSEHGWGLQGAGGEGELDRATCGEVRVTSAVSRPGFRSHLLAAGHGRPH